VFIDDDVEREAEELRAKDPEEPVQ
jgi:hypothetical protein